MKKNIIVVIFLAMLVSLLSQSDTMAIETSNSYAIDIKHPDNSQNLTSKKILVIQFNFMLGGCTYEVFVTFETTTGNGYGWVRRSCPGFPSQTIYFTVYQAVVYRGATTDNLIDFRYEDDSPADISNEEIQAIVNGMNESEEWTDD